MQEIQESQLGPLSFERFQMFLTSKILGTSREGLISELKKPHNGNPRSVTFLVNTDIELIISKNITHSGLRSSLGIPDKKNILIQGRLILDQKANDIRIRDFLFLQNDHEERFNHKSDFIISDMDKIETFVRLKLKELIFP